MTHIERNIDRSERVDQEKYIESGDRMQISSLGPKNYFRQAMACIVKINFAYRKLNTRFYRGNGTGGGEGAPANFLALAAPGYLWVL